MSRGLGIIMDTAGDVDTHIRPQPVSRGCLWCHPRKPCLWDTKRAPSSFPTARRIHPPQPGRWSFVHQRRLTQHLYTISPEMRHCGIKVGDVEADVVAAHVAVLWNCFLLILDIIIK